jgi:hypothetical protein
MSHYPIAFYFVLFRVIKREYSIELCIYRTTHVLIVPNGFRLCQPQRSANSLTLVPLLLMSNVFILQMLRIRHFLD